MHLCESQEQIKIYRKDYLPHEYSLPLSCYPQDIELIVTLNKVPPTVLNNVLLWKIYCKEMVLIFLIYCKIWVHFEVFTYIWGG